MSPARLHLCRMLFSVLPETHGFRLKAWLLGYAGSKIGARVRLCSSVRILGPGALEVGNETWVGHEVLLISGSRIQIGNSVDIGPRVFIGTGTHELDAKGKHSAGLGIHKDIAIGDGVWLGAGAMILPGVTIGTKAVVAAGAVVTKDVVSKTIVGGVPARLLKELEG